MQDGKTVLMGNNSVAEDTSYKRIVSSSILDSPISFANEERYFPINRGPESVFVEQWKSLAVPIKKQDDFMEPYGVMVAHETLTLAE